MKASVERLRAGLVAGAVLLVLVLVGTLGYGKYRAAKLWREVQRRSGAKIERETDGFTYSQSKEGKTLFTMHASKAIQHVDGQWTLHDVIITMYGRVADRADRIYGDSFEYDEKTGVTRAAGEVNMDLQAPASAAAAHRASANLPQTANPEAIHVRTSGFIFLRKLGVAATQEQVEIHYRGMVCTSKGAEFDSGESALHLLADVKVNGVVHGHALTLIGTKADFDRQSMVGVVLHPVLTSAGSSVRAETAVLHLRDDGSAERVEAIGGVVASDAMRQVTASRLDVNLDDDSQLKDATLSGGVYMADTKAARPAHGAAQTVLAKFNADGDVETVTADGGVQFATQAVKSNVAGAPLSRELRADHVVAQLTAGNVKGGLVLRSIHATGNATLRGESMTHADAKHVAERKATTVSGDDLLASFASEGNESVLRKLHVEGHAALQQSGARGDDARSSANALDAEFAAKNGQRGELELTDAVETGHVTLRSVSAAKKPGDRIPTPTTASSDNAAYSTDQDTMTLTGHVHLLQDATQLNAPSVTMDQATGRADASGGVMASLESRDGDHVTHVSADHATLVRSPQVATFYAGAKPARLWQEASQVEAAELILSGGENNTPKTLVAKPKDGGEVHAVFASTEKIKPASAGLVSVTSRTMEYDDSTRQAQFGGGVKMDGATGTVFGQKAVAQLTAVAKKPQQETEAKTKDAGVMAGSLDKLTINGDVRLTQPGREGTGEQVIYTASDQNFVLTGSPNAPPRVVSAEQGTVTGASLLFRAGDSTIVVTSGAAQQKETTRARTVTRVKQ